MASIDQEIKSNFVNNKQKAVINIMFSSNWIRNLNNEIMAKYKISLQQYNIMRILRGSGDKMSMQKVKERMIDKSPNATRLTDKLVEKGYIERTRSEEDRRVVFVKITILGLRVLEDLDEPTDKLTTAYDTLTNEEAEQLSNLLDKLRG